ncbi:hypothetical protein G6011_07827 [Alternaria panax]|uniref:Uncharacterized protein n=1 Tax=Alternaria panax TaxID=48097 RepID=A0AAD4FAS0_9PLEO|nr:hypothetical protein G6011_07827 [Alternaria panax]
MVWDSAKRVPKTPRVRVRPTLKFCGGGSPTMSTIEERSESEDNRFRLSLESSPIDDGPHTPDDDSLRSWITVTSQDTGCTINGHGDAVAAVESGGTDTKDDTVVNGCLIGSEAAQDSGSTPPKDEQLTISICEVTDENHTAALLLAAAVPEPIIDAPHPTPPPPTCPRTTSPSPSPPRQVRQTKRHSFRQRFRRRLYEGTGPTPSLEDFISIPEVVPRQRAEQLLDTLVLARYNPHRAVPTQPTTASSAIVPQEPDDVLQQHAADLHDALARLETLKVDSSDEESMASGRSSFWSRFSCFL